MLLLDYRHYLGIGLGLLLAGVGFFIGAGFRNFLLALSVVVMLLPFIIALIQNQAKQKEKEEMFLSFSRDLVENVKSGTPISKSIINLHRRNYGSLTPHVQKLANQLSLGFPLNRALTTFARESGSKIISRAVGLISEAERAGGDIDSILESVTSSVNQISTLQKERKAAVSSLVTQGYMIFLIFIAIMLVLEIKILPLVTDLGGTEGLSVSVGNVDPGDFSAPLFLLLLVQSFFAGLVIGKISEGSIMKGIRHSFILLVLTLVISTGVKALLG